MKTQTALMKIVILVFSIAFIGFSGFNGGGDMGFAELSSTGDTINKGDAGNLNAATKRFTAVLSSVKDNKIANQAATAYIPGEKAIFSADNVSFSMVFVPGMTFPTGTDDHGVSTVTQAYWVGETEVTYELWNTVYTWSLANGYTFANAGLKGNDGAGGKTNQHPVTTINWRDSMVFCNAMTEWYNAKNGTSYSCVYTYSNAIIRDSRDSNADACDGAVANVNTTGFRLLTVNEWELAARWHSDAANTVTGYNNPYFTKGISASGAKAGYNDGTATGLVAVYSDNSGSSTQVVKSKIPNSLGLYDMSGNVAEWCFDWYKSGYCRQLRGGSYKSPYYIMWLAIPITCTKDYEENSNGIRLAKKSDH